MNIRPKKVATNRGLVRTIVLIAFLLIILAYLGLNLRSIVSSPTFIDNWDFIKHLSSTVWNNYLRVPVVFVWSKVFIPFVWEPIVDNISKRQ